MKIGIFYSSYNNYQLLEKECLEKIDFESYSVINIDDHSNPEQVKKGQEICKKHNIRFVSNSGKGLQFATKTAIDYFSDKSIDWVLCLQQDVKPIGDLFFSSLDNYLQSINSSDIGAIGFNMLDDGKYTDDAYQRYKNGEKPIGWLGTLPLSDNRKFFEKTFFIDKLKFLIKKLLFRKDAFMIHNYRRWFSKKTFKGFEQVSKNYEGLSAIDIPAWPAILININLWNQYIEPDKNFIFHLWFNDIAFQFMKNNIFVATTTEFYFYNDQKAKLRYGMLESSADEGRLNESIFAEDYGNHLKIFKKKWLFSYDKVKEEYKPIRYIYKGTIIDDLYSHNCNEGPIKKFK